MNRMLLATVMALLTVCATAQQQSAIPKRGHDMTTHKCVIKISGTITNVNCNGDNSGAIDLTVTHTKGTVSYLWDDGATSEDRTGLAAGTYSVAVTDETNRQATASFTVTEPAEPITVKVRVTPPSSPGACDGSALLKISGGNPLYSITWNDGSTNSCRTDLCPGNYKVCVTDTNGCSVVTKITIPDATAFSFSSGTASSIMSRDQSAKAFASPNPTKGVVQLSITAKASGTAVINIYDMSGKRLATEKTGVVKGNNVRTVDLGKYSKGLLHVEVMVDGEKKLVKVLVQ
jgi:Secretion system C-terminal sorting domain/SprB repeat